VRWRKIGRVFCPRDHHPWMRTHAANPVAEARGADTIRVYFSCRDDRNRSSIAWVEIDMRRPTEVVRIADHAVVGPGRAGTFDDSGTSMGWLVRRDSQRFLYYLGWNLGVTVPWRNSIGLAISAGQDGEFVRYSEAPIMDRSAEDPFSISYPCVLLEGETWRMWYGSNLAWGTEQADMAHVLKHAQSCDGISWTRDGQVAVGFQCPDEYAMSKPCVIREQGKYRMWYSYRGTAYRIGYAESDDGRCWTRRDHEAGIDPSNTGWDSESIEYPFVFDHAGRRYMLYNGNRYGLTGFGIAELEAE
jgi:hypothetical protein